MRAARDHLCDTLKSFLASLFDENTIDDDGLLQERRYR